MATSLIPLTAIEIAAIETKMTEIEDSLSLEIGLSGSDRMRLTPIGRKTTQFVQRVVESIHLNPVVAPQFVDEVTLNNGYELFNQLAAILLGMGQLERKIADSMLYTGSKTNRLALDFYSTSKRAAKSGVPGAQAIVDTLKPNFRKTKSIVVPTDNADATGDSTT